MATKQSIKLIKGIPIKIPARVATTGSNITLSGGAPNALDSITLVAGDRILVKDQTTPSQNGVYEVTTLGTGANGTWSRVLDFSQAIDIFAGVQVYISEGTTNAKNTFTLTTIGAITVGSTSLTFEQLTQVLNGTGFVKVSGTTITYDNSTYLTTASAASTYSPIAGSSSITTVGTIGTGTWQGTLVAGQYGGTGVNNSGKTITLGGNLTTSGAFALTLTITAATNVTLPTTGTLATLAGSENLTNKTYNKLTITAPVTGSTLTIADGKTLTVSNTLTFTGTDASSVAFGTGGTVAYTNVTTLSSLTSIGTIGTGTWQASVINSTYGGTGVNNGGRTLTINTNSGTITFTLAATTLTVANTASVSGTNTGDQTITLTGDVTGSGTGSFATTVTTQMSLTRDASGIKLSGDSATPGNSMLYGTNASGVKGWYVQPSGGGSGTVNSGTATRLAYYASTGTAVSESSSSMSWDNTNGILTVGGGVTGTYYTLGSVDLAASETWLGGAVTTQKVNRFANGNMTLLANYSLVNTAFYPTLSGGGTITTASSGTHSFVSVVGLTPFTINANATTPATVTNAATLYVQSAATGTATITNNYALWVDAGTTRLDGEVEFQGISSSTTTNILYFDSTTKRISYGTAPSSTAVAGVNTQTASYTLVLGDAGKLVEMNVAAANTLTVPPNSSVAFPVGTEIIISQVGAGQTTITPGSGVTLQAADGALKTRTQYSAATIVKRATDTWEVYGDLNV